MANIKKSFNFRIGVQVDDDNLKVSTTGLVGIGTTVPTEALDVRGNLVLDAASNTVQVTTYLLISGTTTSTDRDTGSLIVKGGAGITGKLHVGDDIVAFNSSDINLKENITVIPNALDKVNSLSGNTFKWKTSATTPEYFQGITDDTGVIAQEVEALGLPGITTTRDDGTKAVRYERLIPVLIQAVKELSAKVTAL